MKKIFVTCSLIVVAVIAVLTVRGTGTTAKRQFQRAELHLANNKPQKAYAVLYKAANTGHAESQHALGNLYYTGIGTEQDYQAARTWFTTAARQGSTEAQKQLGHLYIKGLGVRQNYVVGLAWMFIARDSGDATAAEAVATLENIMSSADQLEARQLANEFVVEIQNNQ